MAGEKFDLDNDSEILKLNSPKKSIDGPYKVVYKNIHERWVIVALDWDNEPNLAIRWFWDKSGNPISRGYPTWLILPSELISSILNGLPISFRFKKKVEKFLDKEIDGNEL